MSTKTVAIVPQTRKAMLAFAQNLNAQVLERPPLTWSESVALLPSDQPRSIFRARPSAHRIAVFHSAEHAPQRLDAALLRAAFAFVDLTFVPDEASETSAIMLGADPERTVRADPAAMERLLQEPPRRSLLKGGTEAGLSIALDAAQTAGLLTMLERLSPDQGLNVVNYHRVLPLDELVQYGRPQMAMGAPVFEAQLQAMSQRQGFIPLDQLRSDATVGRVAITFDDGYEDNFRVALPMLERFSAPACIFLATNLIDQKDALWWDRVGLALYTYWRAGAEAPLPQVLPERVAKLKEAGSLQEARAIITEALSDLNLVDEATRVEATEAALSLVPQLDVQRTMLSWEEVKKMAQAGVSFGSHTRNHVPLDELSKAEALEELFGSQQDLEEKLGEHEPKFTALPRGRLGALTEEELKSGGFSAVMTTDTGINPKDSDSLYVKRRDGKMLTLSGRHHPAKLRLELTGLVDRLRSMMGRSVSG